MLILLLPLSVIYYLLTGAPYLSVLFGTLLVLISVDNILHKFERKQRVLIFVIFVFKYILTVYQAILKNLPMGGVDWWNYHRSAQCLIENFENISSFLLCKSDLFSKIVSVVYFVFGIHTRQINLFILASSFVAAIFVHKCIMILTENDRRMADYGSLFFLLWPIDIIYSVTYLREMPIQMLVIIGFYYFIHYQKIRKNISLAKACIALALACMMHSGVIGILLIILLCMNYHEGDSLRTLINPLKIILFCLLMCCIVISPIWQLIIAKLGNFENVDDIVRRVNQFNISANTKYISDMPTSFSQILFQVPMRTLMFAIVPLPWMVYDFETFIALLLDAIPQLFFIYLSMKLYSVTKKDKKDRYWVNIFWGCLLSTYVVCGLGTTAYGNAIRHRAKIFPIVCVYIAGLYGHIANKKIHRGKVS